MRSGAQPAPGISRPPLCPRQRSQGVLRAARPRRAQAPGCGRLCAGRAGPRPLAVGAAGPIRGAAAARRTGKWEGPGGWREALEGKTTRFLVEFASTEVVPARRRRELIRRYGRGKVRTLRLVVPFKEKRNADGAVAKKKARTTAGDLASNGKIPAASPANLADETSRYTAQLELQLKGDLAT